MNEPFWLTPDVVETLTDREKWEWYIKPGMERAKRVHEEIHGKTFKPETEEESILALAMLGITVPPEARGKSDGKSG
jgi:hypothetical protein